MVERSTLYNINPEGIGTPYVESLTSYISRLANAHCIQVGDLISNIYAPLLNKEYLSKVSIRGGEFYESARGINGVRKVANEFSLITNKLTGREDVSFTTLQRWSSILPTQGLLKTKKSWCPLCYEEAYLSGDIVYEQLIWNFKLVTHCLKHKMPLLFACAHCNEEINVIDRSSSPGNCSKCNKWLGSKTSMNNINKADEDTFSHINLIGELLADIKFNIANTSSYESLKHYVETVFNNSPIRAAAYFKIPKSTFMTWMSGKALPSFTYLIKICRVLGITIIGFLKKQSQTLNENTYGNQISHKKRLNHDEIQKTLKKVIENKEPLSISAVAEKVGCDRKLLSTTYKEECDQIKETYNAFIKSNKQKRYSLKVKQLRDAFDLLVSKGIYPSRRQLENLLGVGFLKERALQKQWIELKSCLDHKNF